MEKRTTAIIALALLKKKEKEKMLDSSQRQRPRMSLVQGVASPPLVSCWFSRRAAGPRRTLCESRKALRLLLLVLLLLLLLLQDEEG